MTAAHDQRHTSMFAHRNPKRLQFMWMEICVFTFSIVFMRIPFVCTAYKVPGAQQHFAVAIPHNDRKGQRYAH